MKHTLLVLLFTLEGFILCAQPGLFKYNIAPSVENSFPQYLTAFGDRLVFFAVEGTKGWEPWVTDSAGPAINIANLNPPANGSCIEPSKYAKPTCVADGRFYFSCNNNTAGAELYSWSGGTTAPALVSDIETGADGSYPDNLVTTAFDIYFKAGTAAEGTELYNYNITSGSTTLLSHVNPGTDSFVTGNLIIYNSNVLFTGKTSAGGNELYMYDRTNDTVILVADINPGPASSDPQDLTIASGKLYFSADDGVHGRELFAFAGIGSLQRVTDINSGVSSSIASYGVPHITGYNGKVYFAANNGNSEFHMYSYDPATSQIALACSTNVAGSSNPTWLTNYGGKIYFSSYDTAKGQELWSFDGTNPPVRITDLCPGIGNGKPQNLTVIGTNLYFRANECNGIGDELFRYNYITAGIERVQFGGTAKAYPNPADDYFKIELALEKPENLFIVLTDVTGRKLWESGSKTYYPNGSAITVPLQGLAAGTYAYIIYAADGGRYTAGKIVKQ